MGQSLVWYNMKAMFKICSIHLKHLSIVTSVCWPYSRFVSVTNGHQNPKVLAKWPRACVRNFSARNINFESPALLSFNYLPDTHTQHTHTRCTSMCIGFSAKVLVPLLCAVMDDMSPGRELFLRVCGL